MNRKQDKTQEGRWSKLKRVLKKGAKKLIPVAAGWAAGMIFPPAGNILYTFLKNKISETGMNISVADGVLRQICEDTIGKKSVGYLKKKLRELLEKGNSLNPEQLEMTLEPLLRPVNESLEEAMGYIREYPEQISYLMEEWKEENRELIQQLNLNMEAGFEDIKSTISEKNKKILHEIDKVLKEFFRLERKMDNAFAKNVRTIFSTEIIEELDLRLVSKAQLAMARYHSKFGVPYSSELFVPRKEADETFVEYLEDILSPFTSGKYLFLLLAGAGMGKTWTLASWSERISQNKFESEELERYVPFFITLRKGFETQFSGFFGASNKLGALSNLRKAANDSGLTPILFLDGLDELFEDSSKEARSLLNFLPDILADKIPVVLSCRDSDWAHEEKIKDKHKELKESCFEHPHGESISIQEISCKPSVYLEEFTDDEFRSALKKYDLPMELLRENHLVKMARKPILLRLFSEFYAKHGFLPDAKNPDDFEPLFLGKLNAAPENYILGRLGITGTKRDYLLRVIGQFSEKKELTEFELSELKREREDFKALRSSGLLLQKWGGYQTVFSLNELYYPHLMNWAKKAKGVLIKKSPVSESRDQKKAAPKISDDPKSKVRQRCDYLIESARKFLGKSEYEEALDRLRQSRELCDKEIFDNELLMSIDSFIEKIETARQTLESARSHFEDENWEETIRLASKAKPLFEEFGDTQSSEIISTLLSNAQEKQSTEENMRRKTNQLMEEGKQQCNEHQWEEAINCFSEAKTICSNYGWEECAQRAESMITKVKEEKEFYTIREFRGTKLFQGEIDILREIESLLGKEFLLVERFDSNYEVVKSQFITHEDSVIGLKLYRNELTKLPESIGNLKNLQTLNLSDNRLTELPQSIGNLQNLQVLSLQENKLTELPESIGNLKNLQTLNLSFTKLRKLPEFIGNLLNLQTLNLSYNGLTELPESIGNLQSLQDLNLGVNKLTELPQSIGNLQSLKTLNLGIIWGDPGNQITELPESIGNLKNLQTLNLSDNRLTELPQSIGNLQNLQVLSLQENKLMELPQAIGNLQKLQGLYLFRNKLTELPESFGNLQNLQTLELWSNKLTELPKTLLKLENLRSIDLRDNPLDTKTFGKTPTEKILSELKKKGTEVKLKQKTEGLPSW